MPSYAPDYSTRGGKQITDTAGHTEGFAKFVATEATVINYLGTTSNLNLSENVTLAAFDFIEADFSLITLVSGAGIAYYKK